jgi:hypothetical protein
MGGAILCPICGNNQAYCKCTRLEKEQFWEIARLREERRWVSVEERLPELNKANHFQVRCLVCCKSGGVCEMTYEINTYAKQERNRQPRWKWQGLIDRSEVTHWQPLPLGPEGDGWLT